MKTCKTCGEAKDAKQFYAHKNTSDGLRPDCIPCHKIKCEVWREANKEKDARTRRNAALLRKYGLTITEYEKISDKQQGCCAVCGLFGSGTVQHSSLVVDHDHRTGKVRGLLCDKCNRGIGLLQDSPKNLMAAYKYIVDNT